MKYRLYIDEVGNSDLQASLDPNHRYLSLTGIILELDYVAKIVFPALEKLKQNYFNSHPDEPIIFHRKELVNKRYPFNKLQDTMIEQRFNAELLTLLQNWDYGVITIVMDKLEHQQRYQTWRYDPYHYCLAILVERYVLWLKDNQNLGDVMAESRGGKEDMRLKNSFTCVFTDGTNYIKPEIFTQYLTSKELKVKPKANNIAGLQLADLIAHPSFRATLARRENQPLATNFGGEIAKILEKDKYYRSKHGLIDEWGRKWLP